MCGAGVLLGEDSHNHGTSQGGHAAHGCWGTRRWGQLNCLLSGAATPITPWLSRSSPHLPSQGLLPNCHLTHPFLTRLNGLIHAFGFYTIVKTILSLPSATEGRRKCTDSSPHYGWISALFANFQSFQGETLEPAPTDVAGGAGRQLVGDGVVGDALDGVIVPGSKQLR